MSFKNIFGVPCILALTGAVMLTNSLRIEAQNPNAGSAPVHIVNPLPLPVTGSVTLESGGSVLNTKNVDQPGRSPYQVTSLFSPSSCTFNSVLYFCPLSFPVVPAGKRLIIEHISMFVAESAGGSPDSLRFLNSFNGTAFWVQPTFTPRVGTPDHSFLDRPVLVYYDSGENPNVLLAVTKVLAAAEMSVQGYLIDAN